jgi:hypothetical protein
MRLRSRIDVVVISSSFKAQLNWSLAKLLG